MKIRKTDKKTPKPWELDLGLIKGRRRREFYATEDEAKSAMGEKLDELRRNGENSLALNTRLRLEYAAAEEELKKMGMTITQAVLYCKANCAILSQRPLKDAISECIAAKIAAGNRGVYTDGLRRSLESLATSSGVKYPEQITRLHVEKWASSVLKRKGKKSVTLYTVRSRIIDANTFFSFCLKKKWVLDNPCHGIEKISVEEKPPGIHTVDQVRALLEAALKFDVGLLGYLCPIYFGGLRPSEAMKLSAADVHADYIEVAGRKSKGRKRRFVPINETLKAWLAVPGVRFGMSRWSRRSKRIRGKAKVPWLHDVLRHSFCSYSLPIYGATKTAEWAGHSEQILFAHYRERVKPDAAHSYWQLLPANVREGK